MRLPIKASHVPVRLATGAFILDSGLGKRGADEGTAAGLHGMAAGTYPQLQGQDPQRFVKLLSGGEIALGAALLLPVVPSAVAGAALTAFSAGLLGLYARTPGMRRPGSVFPSPQGIGVAKDVWMLGIGLGLVVDALADRRR
ncbi:hypothetical protein [Vallicoccus soli]|uniref:DoxX family membrane protein n=1 Tax=Vallicoccus soli TaxID=2339232 RepID=A0A3A3YS69_9ACTN|nr:hypothetical protein [Vallicoccus soli]RJK93486.1 hypothetical protein D5H78_16885 [Vallicoccus soli]